LSSPLALPSGDYDECTGRKAYAEAVKTIPKVARPGKDPVYGRDGPLLELWSIP